MKKVVLILFMLFSLTTLAKTAKDSIQPPTTTQEVERLVDKYGGKIIDGFNTVVKEVTPVAEQGFKIAVKLNIAEGIGLMLPIIFFFFFLSWFLREYSRIDNILKSDNIPIHMDKKCGPMDSDNGTPSLVISLVFTCVLFILSLFCTMSGIKHLIAPEWYAIQDIINLFK